MTYGSERRKTQAEIEKEKEPQKEVDRQRQALIRDIRRTFASDHGRRTLKFILDESGYQRYGLSANPETGEVFDSNSSVHLARQNLYIKLRQFVSREVLIAVEIDKLKNDEDILE